MLDFGVGALYVLVFGGSAAATFCLLGWVTSWRRPWSSAAVALATVAIIAWILLFLPDDAPVTVRIENPNDGRAVATAWPTLEGVVSPTDAHVIVLVHPDQSDEDQPWWVQAPVHKGIGGAWRAEVNLGSSTIGKSRHFQVVAVASVAPWFVGKLRGQWLQEGDRVAQPPPLPTSQIVSMWRTE